MTIVNPLSWILAAQKEGFAIGGFNANTFEQLQAIVAAAQLEKAPVIVQISHRALQYLGGGNEIHGLKYFTAMAKTAAESVDVPIALHLDHGTEIEAIQAIALGFSSVMFDGENYPFEENIAISKKIAILAHTMNVCTEAEIGVVPKPDGAEINEADLVLTDPDDALEFVQKTGVDTLAIALGSVHGMQTKENDLDLNRLEKIRAKVDLPLVLHGSSGVTNESILAAFKMGLSKINIATQLNKAFTAGVRSALEENKTLVDPRKYLGRGTAAQVEVVRERIRFLGSSGKAGLL
jgi:fructose-bisphosphate aldolase class II